MLRPLLAHWDHADVCVTQNDRVDEEELHGFAGLQSGGDGVEVVRKNPAVVALVLVVVNLSRAAATTRRRSQWQKTRDAVLTNGGHGCRGKRTTASAERHDCKSADRWHSTGDRSLKPRHPRRSCRPG